MHYRGTTALITGASSGLGEQFAADLAARGADLVLVARRGDRLDALAQRLREERGVAVLPLATDLSAPGAGTALRSTLTEHGTTVSTLVNSAGLAATGAFAASDPAAVRSQVAVDVAALVELTHAFLPDLLARGDGALVNVASMTAYSPVPGMAVYAASKAFVLSFTEALAVELRASPLKVLTLSPGPVRTEFYAVSGTSEGGTRFETPAQVVATALTALDARRTPRTVISGRHNRRAHALSRLLPRDVVTDVMGRSVQTAH